MSLSSSPVYDPEIDNVHAGRSADHSHTDSLKLPTSDEHDTDDDEDHEQIHPNLTPRASNHAMPLARSMTTLTTPHTTIAGARAQSVSTHDVDAHEARASESNVEHSDVQSILHVNPVVELHTLDAQFAGVETDGDNPAIEKTDEAYYRELLKKSREEHVQLCEAYTTLREEVDDIREKNMDNELSLSATSTELKLSTEEVSRKRQRVDELQETLRVRDEELEQMGDCKQWVEKMMSTNRGLTSKLDNAKHTIQHLRDTVKARDSTIAKKVEEIVKNEKRRDVANADLMLAQKKILSFEMEKKFEQWLLVNPDATKNEHGVYSVPRELVLNEGNTYHDRFQIGAIQGIHFNRQRNRWMLSPKHNVEPAIAWLAVGPTM